MKKVVILAAIVAMVLGEEIGNPPTSVLDLIGNIEVVGWGKENKPLHTAKIYPPPKPLPKNAPVGCRDSDHDGVPDYLDLCPNTPKGFGVNYRGCPVLFTFPFRVLFDFNKAKVKKIYYSQLKKVAEAMKNNPYLKIEVAGYTDNRGSRSYNLKLSLQRAKEVRDVLVNYYHISPKRIRVKGYGEDHPLVPNTTSTNRALNRRVEIIDISGEIPPSKLPKPKPGEVAACSKLSPVRSASVSKQKKPTSPLLTSGIKIYKPTTSYQKAFGKPHPINIDKEVIKYSPSPAKKRVYKLPSSNMKNGATPKIEVEYIN